MQLNYRGKLAYILMHMSDQSSSKEFDDWAETYDTDVLAPGFPFAGYEFTLDQIVKLSMIEPGMQILDLGSGTGNLTSRFVTNGCEVTGVDFSEKMMHIATSQNPTASFFKADLRTGPPQTFLEMKFDRIVSAYTFHHFPLPEKYNILKCYKPFLTENGFFVIGDITFTNNAVMQNVKTKTGPKWEDEDYWLTDQTIDYFSERQGRVEFLQTSVCAGVLRISFNPEMPVS